MAPEVPASPPRRVAILGLGVMGGSLARALSGLTHPPERTGWSPDPREGRAALADGALDRVAATPADAARDAEVVVLAAPLGACVEMVPHVLEHMMPKAVLTDVASLKTDLEVAVTRAGGLDRWVGGHPMCGRASSGYAASDPNLYRDARVWIVAHEGARYAAGVVSALWSSVGAHTVRTTAPEHDALMALVSHLPQLTANALAAVLEEKGIPADALGSGGRDMTRLAGSAPEMWRDLLDRSHPALPDALRALARQGRELADLVEGHDADELARRMERTRGWRNRR